MKVVITGPAPFDGQWAARRGQYRIRYRIDVERDDIHVLDAEHRAETYRP